MGPPVYGNPHIHLYDVKMFLRKSARAASVLVFMRDYYSRAQEVRVICIAPVTFFAFVQLAMVLDFVCIAVVFVSSFCT